MDNKIENIIHNCLYLGEPLSTRQRMVISSYISNVDKSDLANCYPPENYRVINEINRQVHHEQD